MWRMLYVITVVTIFTSVTVLMGAFGDLVAQVISYGYLVPFLISVIFYVFLCNEEKKAQKNKEVVYDEEIFQIIHIPVLNLVAAFFITAEMVIWFWEKSGEKLKQKKEKKLEEENPHLLALKDFKALKEIIIDLTYSNPILEDTLKTMEENIDHIKIKTLLINCHIEMIRFQQVLEEVRTDDTIENKKEYVDEVLDALEYLLGEVELFAKKKKEYDEKLKKEKENTLKSIIREEKDSIQGKNIFTSEKDYIDFLKKNEE